MTEADELTRRSGVPGALVDLVRRLPSPVGDVASGTVERLRGTRFVGLVAEVAFFTAAGLAPLAIAILAFIGAIGPLVGDAAVSHIEDLLRQFIVLHLARDAATAATRDVTRLLSAGVLPLAWPFLLALFLSSRGFTGAMRGLGHLYGMEARRAPWKDALATFCFATGAATIGTLAAIGVMVRPVGAGGVASVYGWARWVVIPAAVVAYLTTLYWWSRGRRGPWTEELPGALVAAAGVIGSAVVYAAYLRSVPTLGLGPFVGVVVGVLLGTFTLTFALAAFVLIGGAVNAELGDQ